jgi:hypothetical protein
MGWNGDAAPILTGERRRVKVSRADRFTTDFFYRSIGFLEWEIPHMIELEVFTYLCRRTVCCDEFFPTLHVDTVKMWVPDRG